jgi:hypothetical protein
MAWRRAVVFKRPQSFGAHGFPSGRGSAGAHCILPVEAVRMSCAGAHRMAQGAGILRFK